MGKQWITLLVLGLIVVGIWIAYSIYSILGGGSITYVNSLYTAPVPDTLDVAPVKRALAKQTNILVPDSAIGISD